MNEENRNALRTLAKMKTAAAILIIAFSISSCTENQKLDNQEKAQISIEVTDSIMASEQIEVYQDPIFKEVSGFPVIKDSSEFIKNLRQAFGFEVDEISYQKKNGIITSYKKVNVYGSENDYILIEYDYHQGCGSAFPWKYQFLLTKDGKLVNWFGAQRYEFVEIFKNESPFLLIVEGTSKGNGGHEIFKFSGDTLEDVLDYDLPYYLRTYDAHHDNMINEPFELDLRVSDFNNDGFNDLCFNGKFVLLERNHGNGVWSGGEIRNGKKVNYSVDNPFKKVPVELIFLFDKETKHFRAKEDYAKKYESYE